MKRYSISVIIGLMICYEIGVKIIQKSIILPSLTLVFSELIRIIFSSSFVIVIQATLLRTILTFLFLFAIILVVGILSGYFKRIEWLLLPIVTFLRTVPTISITLILLIWFGKEFGPIMIMGLVVFPILYELIVGAMKQIDHDLLDVCLLFGATKIEKFKALYYPQLLKTLSSGIQATIGLSFKVMVMAEVMAQSSVGIGQMLNYEKTYLNIAAVFAWTTILIVLVMIFELISSLLIDALIRHLET